MNKGTSSIILISLLFLMLGCNQAAESIDTGDATSAPTAQSTIPAQAVTSPPPTHPNATSSPGIITPTPSITPAEVSSQAKLNGVIYLWMHRYLDPLYTSVDLSKNDLPINLEVRVSPRSLVSENRMTIGLAIAPYSPLVAYLTKTNESLELWLADLNLEQAEILWELNPLWLGSVEDPGNANIKWGPSDASLILSSFLNKDHLVLYSLKAKKAFEVTGACDQVAPLPDTDQLTVWCSFEYGAPSPYGYFALDGDIVFAEDIPGERVGVYEWAFARGGKRIAFTPKQGNVTIVTDQKSSIELPARLLGEPGDYRTKPFIQWSENGEKLLVFGYNQEFCPLRENPASGNLDKNECWLVADTRTGKILWGPTMVAEGIRKVVGYPLEISYSFCAGLSPDGNWIAICIASGAIQDFVITALDDSQSILDFGSGGIMDFKWVEGF